MYEQISKRDRKFTLTEIKIQLDLVSFMIEPAFMYIGRVARLWSLVAQFATLASLAAAQTSTGTGLGVVIFCEKKCSFCRHVTQQAAAAQCQRRAAAAARLRTSGTRAPVSHGARLVALPSP